MEKISFVVDKETKLEKFLLQKGIDFVSIKTMLRAKDVKINGKRVNSNCLLAPKDTVECFMSKSSPSPKTDRNIEIIFSNDNVAIVNKPKGIECCGINGLEGFLGLIPVHRLDRNTTGLVVFAKNDNARIALEKVFKDRLIEKKYICEVVGDSDFDGKIYTAYLFKDAKKSRVIISSEKKDKYVQIQTKFLTIKHGIRSSMVECELLTGKTHQIRAHLAYLGHAIVGDGKYGKNEDNKFFKEKTQKLCCNKITFGKLNADCLKDLSGKTFDILPYWEEISG